MTVEFYPQYNISRRYRYTSETKEKTLSPLHFKELEFRLDNLENHQNWQLNLSAINYNNTAKHEGVKLHYSKNINNEDNIIIIKTNQIKFDFIEIEIIKKSKLKGKQRENIRILAELKNPETGDKLEIISKIIRNKSAGIKDELDIYSIGRSPSSSPDKTWEHLILTFKHLLLYYPEEITLQINDRILNCSTETNSSLQYNSYEFIIPEEILRDKEKRVCVLECLSFKKRKTFSHNFSDVETRKRKSYKSDSQDTPALTDLGRDTQCRDKNFHKDISNQVQNIGDITEEPVVKKPLLEEQNTDLYITPKAETLGDMIFKNVGFNYNVKNEIFHCQLESEFAPRTEFGNNPVQSLCSEDILDELFYENSNPSFSEKGFLDHWLTPEDTNFVMLSYPDSLPNWKSDELEDILNSCRTE